MGNILDEFKTQELCDKAFEKDPYNFVYVPEEFRTQDMCEKAFDINRYYF